MRKKSFIIILCLLSSIKSIAQCTYNSNSKTVLTTIGLVIYSNDTETIWNAIRLANFSKNKGDTVSIFLLGKGVELDALVKSNADLKEQVDEFLKNKGTILGCGTCLQSRNNDDPKVCKFSSMSDLYYLIRKNKIVLTF
jgi:uncharacterized protein involved in oxidation of intracellular sulfur